MCEVSLEQMMISCLKEFKNIPDPSLTATKRGIKTKLFSDRENNRGRGKGEKELAAVGLFFDEDTQQIYIADCVITEYK